MGDRKLGIPAVIGLSLAAVLALYGIVYLVFGKDLFEPRAGEGPKLVNLFEEQTRHVGETVVARASLLERGRPVRDAQVSALLFLPNDQRVIIPLADDGVAPDSTRGDGRFAGIGPVLSMPGIHQLIVSAKRREPRPLTLATGGTFPVSRSRSHFNGRIGSRLIDDNHDGLLDQLRLRVGVTATDPVKLGLSAYLSAGETRLLGMAQANVTAGEESIDVDVPLGRLVAKGYRGTFVVDSLVLDEEDRRGMYPLDVRVRPYTTGQTSIAADTVRSPYWTRRVSAHGVDRDGNGRFESLVVELGVAGLPYAGTYYAHAELFRGPWGLTIGGEYVKLPSDSATVRLEFPGNCIAKTPSPDGLQIRRFALFYLESGKVSKRPHTSFQVETVRIGESFAAESFEPKGPEKFRSKNGGTYECW